MAKFRYDVIGLMSGTSLDGLDIVFCSLVYKDGKWEYQINNAQTIEYPNSFLKSLAGAHQFSGLDLAQLNVDLGKFFGQAVNKFIQDNAIIGNIDFIASHGHTIFHEPEKGLTLQIGCPQTITSTTRLQVIADFRTLDVTLGGQGAPLVPIGDKLLFANYEACLNLGGFANVSTEQNNKRVAWDICPVNFVMNYYSLQNGLPYDEDGKMAKKGAISIPLYDSLNNLEFYKKSFPKSLGREWVEINIFPLIDSFDLSVEDVLATFLEHCAFQISSNLKAIIGEVLVTGGGVYNSMLFERMQEFCDCKLVKPNPELIDFKEALIFSFLGVLKARQEINTLSSVTGASRDSCGGVVYFA